MKDIKIKILTEMLQKASGKKVILEANSELDFKNFDKTDIKLLSKSYNYLMKVLSPGSQEVLKKFTRSANGWNRSMIISKLAYVFGFTPAKKVLGTDKDVKLTKSALRSYSNTDLFALIENGDLVQEGKYLVPKNKPQNKSVEKVPSTAPQLDSQVQKYITKIEQLTGKKVTLS